MKIGVKKPTSHFREVGLFFVFKYLIRLTYLFHYQYLLRALVAQTIHKASFLSLKFQEHAPAQVSKTTVLLYKNTY